MSKYIQYKTPGSIQKTEREEKDKNHHIPARVM